MEKDKIDNWFMYHPPTADQVDKYATLRMAGNVLANAINNICPDSADKTDAIRKVREAIMVANSSIACGGK